MLWAGNQTCLHRHVSCQHVYEQILTLRMIIKLNSASQAFFCESFSNTVTNVFLVAKYDG